MTLLELIMTRVSHDLAGISGALFNTAELLELDPSFAPEAGPLLKESTSNLLARLRLFRALFGLETKEVTTALATDYFKTLSAPFVLEGVIQTRLQLGAAIVCSEVLIRGGSVQVSDHQVEVVGQIHMDEQTRAVLGGNIIEPSPRQALVLWLQSYAKENNISLQVKIEDRSMSIAF